jgi:hypothetical protein
VPSALSTFIWLKQFSLYWTAAIFPYFSLLYPHESDHRSLFSLVRSVNG